MWHTKLNVADFYKINGLGSGDYQVEYLLNDSSVGTKKFKIKITCTQQKYLQ